MLLFEGFFGKMLLNVSMKSLEKIIFEQKEDSLV